MATIDELDAKVRELESEITGEKAVTRHIFEQGRRNTSDLIAIRSEITIMRAESGERLDRLAGDMVLVNAALNSHGTRLNTLTQDVTLIRQDVTALRREIERDIEGVNARLDRFEADVAARFDRLESNVAAILAAVVPEGSMVGVRSPD
jgi:chromosome segregation ATPase